MADGGDPFSKEISQVVVLSGRGPHIDSSIRSSMPYSARCRTRFRGRVLIISDAFNRMFDDAARDVLSISPRVPPVVR
jgi:hypothetical protein